MTTEPKPIDPKPYLEYLDKEMTIMGLLSAFSVTLTSFGTEKIVSAKEGFLHCVWQSASDHVIAGAATAVIAALFFYLQRSRLAWYYGQIALAQSRGTTAPEPVSDWLTLADGWNIWVRYQTGFIMLALSFAYYSYAIAKALGSFPNISREWTIGFPFLVAVIIVVVRWRVLVRFAQEDYPFTSWWRALRKTANPRNASD